MSDGEKANPTSLASVDDAGTLSPSQREAVASNNSIAQNGEKYNSKNQHGELRQAVREAGVDPEMVYNELNNIYGAIPTGETPARDVQVPRRISEEEAVGRTARTIMEAAATPDNRLGSVREAVVDGKFSYTEISNQELADSAAQRIESDGWQKSLTDWTAAVRQNQANENLAAMGAQLLNNAGNSDMSAEQYIDLATDYNRLMHNLGRGLAAGRILKTLTPEGKLYGIMRSIESLVDEANGKYNVEIDQALIDEYRAQTTDEGRDAVISKMQQNIADQIPSTWMDKFTALRYTNMLGNFKTQIRNVVGNILMTLGRTVKDKLAAVIESAASAASGGQVERTKSFWAGTPLYGEAMRDFANVERETMGESKYSDSDREFDRAVQEKRTIFKNNGKWGTDEAKTGIGRSAAAKGARKVSDLGMAGMEAYRKATNWAMEQGDRIFVRINYADALAGWLKAHGISSIPHQKGNTPMLYEDNTAKLLGLEDVIIKKVWEDESAHHIELELPRRKHSCPCCGAETDRIHDYRKQKIKDISAFGKDVYLYLRKRRYVCDGCGKRFYEKNSFLPRYPYRICGHFQRFDYYWRCADGVL